MGRKEQENRLGLSIHRAMAERGVSPMPRNYELFYDFIIGANPRLTAEMKALPEKPTQADLDAVIGRYLPQHSGGGFVDRMTTFLEKLASSVLAATEQETKEVATFNEAVEFAAGHIEAGVDRERLLKVAGILAKAGRKKVGAGEKAVETLERSADDVREMRQELERFKELANTDPITSLANRRCFDEFISRLYDRGKPKGKALILIDIDRFKQFNDRYGHPAGDCVLSTVGRVLKGNVRNARVSRVGGEEFAVMLDGVDEEGAMAVAERLREAVEATEFRNGSARFDGVTISLGACMADNASSGEELYEKADVALYRSKAEGRNRVSAAGRGPAPSEGPRHGERKNYRLYEAAEELEKERERARPGPAR